MTAKAWHIDRRTLLRGVGVSMALPFLEGMARGGAATTMPPRFCGLQFPYGCGKPVVKDPKDKDFEILQQENWGFSPTGTRTDYALSKVLEPLEPCRGGVTPPLGRHPAPNGRLPTTLHGASDAFFTGTAIGPNNLRNTVSADQLLAHHLGDTTRHASFVFGVDGGIGVAGASKTLSYAMNGDPVPAEANPRQIFERLFSAEKNRERAGSLAREKSVLDRVLDESKSLANRLGRQDQRRLDEYLQSVRYLEQQVARQQQWIDKPLPEVDKAALRFDTEDPIEYLRVMFDLIVLVLQTDMARYGTFQIGSQGNNGDYGPHEAWPKKLGFCSEWHSPGHGANLPISRWIRVLVEQYAYFLERMRSIKEPDGTLLDNTLVLFGSANSVGHGSGNNPIVLAGGGNMQFKHGQFIDYTTVPGKPAEKPPLANALLTIMQQCGLKVKSFADSTGPLAELLG
jgi:hypothetical protein